MGKVLSFLLGLFVFAACAGIGALVGGAGASVTSVATLGAFIVGDGALFVGIGSAIGLVAGCMAGKHTWPRSGDVVIPLQPSARLWLIVVLIVLLRGGQKAALGHNQHHHNSSREQPRVRRCRGLKVPLLVLVVSK